MPLDLTLPPPAIVHSWTIERRYGFNNDPLTTLRLDPDTKISDLPPELQSLPEWSLATFMVSPLIGFGGGSNAKSFTYLTTTSAGNQSWSVLPAWNISDNKLEIVSHGGNSGTAPGGGGGGGGYSTRSNVSLTPGGTMTYRLRAGGSGTGDAGASWLNATTFAASSCGVRGAANGVNAVGGAGALTTSATGATNRAGGSGGGGFSSCCDPDASGGGGGAAGPTGIGGNGTGGGSGGSNGIGGTADGGTVPSNSSGSEFSGGKGCGAGANFNNDAHLYGGGGAIYSGGGSGPGAQGIGVLTNNASLP